jgi:hypothetical protein
MTDESGINDGNGRLTPLAFKFCENLKPYRLTSVFVRLKLGNFE